MEFQEMILGLKNRVEELDIRSKQVVIWGTGHTTMLYNNAFKTACINIYAYASNDLEKVQYCGKKIIRPNEINQLTNPFVVICVKDARIVDEILAQIKGMVCDWEYMMVDEFLFGLGADKIFANLEVLADDKSKQLYKNIITKRIHNSADMYEEFEENQYFALPMFRVDNNKECFVDMGGFVGDTLERYLFIKYGMFKKYYVFEPDCRNFGALQARIARLMVEWNLHENSIVPVFAGVGKRSETNYFAELAGSSYGSHFSLEKTENERKVYSLDDFFAEEKVDFLKADIESYEFDMLEGAKNILKRDKPKLAISIYHNAVDMYNIQDWIDKLNIGYKFYIRHHSVRDTETILYAYCD